MEAVEATILLGLQSVRVVGLTQLMAFISALGNAAFIWLLCAVIMLFFAEKRQVGIIIVVAVVVTAIVSELVLSGIFERARPSDAQIGVTAVMGVSRTGLSFPSFHAAASAAATMVIALMVGRAQALPAVIGTLLISFSRLFLGVNYPTDVLAGLALGIVIGIVVTWLYNQFLGTYLREKLGARTRNKRTSVGSGKHSRY